MAYLLILSYFIGSIPFGLLLTKISGFGDIRKIGSGNIGATNVLRTGNKKLAALTLLLDAGKGAILIIILNYFFPYNPNFSSASKSLFTAIYLLVGLFIIIGHCFPIWLKFKGGKGVATSIGVLLAATPYAGIIACITWILLAAIFKISSLAALIAALVAPLATFFLYGQEPAIIATLITLLIWLRHKDNIKRILNGTEPKIGGKKDAV